MQRPAVRINLGSGPFRAPGWINVDLVADRRPDLVADLFALPFGGGTVDAIYAGHVFEHLGWATALEAVALCRSLLRDGGEMLLVGPDLEGASWMAQGGEITLEELDSCLFGAEDEGMGHRWVGVEWRWRKLAEAGGFTDVVALPIGAVDEGWPVVSRIGWQAAVLCRRDPQLS